MKAEKIQPILSSKMITASEKSIIPRKVLNSVGLDSDYYVSSKASKKKIKYFQEDEEKMKHMNNVEKKCYEAYLILTGNYTSI